MINAEHGDIQIWLAQLSESGLAGASVRKAQGVLSGILGLVVNDRRIPSNRHSALLCHRS